MREALLAVLPDGAPGMTESQMRQAVLRKLPEDLFPGGERAGWWSKAVQLDLEAKAIIVREAARGTIPRRRARGLVVEGRPAGPRGEGDHRPGVVPAVALASSPGERRGRRCADAGLAGPDPRRGAERGASPPRGAQPAL